VEGTGLDGPAGGSWRSRRSAMGERVIIAMEPNCGALREGGVNSDRWLWEESSEVDSGGVVGGLRGFQGEPRLGRPLGRVIGGLVQLSGGRMSAW
jgi:hypothetical protein